jgi:hypothetical protein
MHDEAYDYEDLTVSTLAVGLNSTKVEAHSTESPGVTIGVTSGAICYRYDGGTPTSSTAQQLEAGDYLMLDTIAKMRNFKAIRRDSDDATLGVTYLK